MPAWHGKSKGNKIGYGIFVAVLKTLGISPAYFLLRFVSVYYFLISYKSSKHIIAYFKRLGISRIHAFSKLYANYFLFGQTLIDRVVLLSGIRNRFSFEFEGEDYLRQMVDMRKGGLLLSAHIGNWEIAGHLLKRLNTPVHIVMFDGEHEKIKQYLDAVTGERWAHIIIIKNDFSHIYEISDALKNNELVCIHADRFLEGNKVLNASLLGEPAQFPAGPFLLACTFRVPVSFVFAMKETNLHYHFYASEPRYCIQGDREIAQQALLSEFTVELEKKMKAYPEQWYNYYDFWAK
jgi:predicted LPLAT superfamily acyltransferase